MAKIDMDITKTEDLFEKMNNCVKVYIDNIDSFFGDIMASESWQGPSSKRYKEIISKEQNSYYTYGDAIEKLVDLSKSSVDDLKANIRNNSLE